MGLVVRAFPMAVSIIGPPYLMDINFQEWKDQNFPTKDRLQMMIVKAENVLTPESLQKMFRLHQAVQNISVEDKTFKNICTK